MPSASSSRWARRSPRVGEVRVEDRPHGVEQVARALVERARRKAVGLALDAPVDRVGRGRVESGEPDGRGVGPRAVMVAAEQQHGPVGNHLVEQAADRRTAGVVVHRPSPAEDPRLVGMRRGVRSHALDGVRGIRRLGEVALEQLDSAADRVDVGVLEAGAQQSAAEVHDAGVGADVRGGLGVGDDRGDAAARDGDRAVVERGAGAGEDRAAGEEQICGHVVASSRELVGWSECRLRSTVLSTLLTQLLSKPMSSRSSGSGEAWHDGSGRQERTR